jgi:hypothetical protein
MSSGYLLLFSSLITKTVLKIMQEVGSDKGTYEKANPGLLGFGSF